MTPTKPASRLIASIAIGAALSLAPLFPPSPPIAVAEGPAVSVTGLSRGSRGDAVRSVQQALVGQGVRVAGGVDGIFGPGTEAALEEFQRRHGLNASGVVDDATALALGLASSPLLGLTQGNRGDAVRKLQQRLVDAGIAVSGGVDGIFGPGTKRAVAEFQKRQGFATTGVVNAATAAALGSVSTKAPTASSSGTTSTTTSTTTTSTTTSTSAETSQPSSGLRGLKIGARGDAVKALQRKLMAAGFTVVGGADGIFGALTSNALKSFQNANGTAVNGVVDDATLAALSTIDDGSAAETHEPTVTNPFVGLRYGSIGADVKSLQSALMAAGISVRGGADGIFGPATRAAVERFQQQVGLTQTGQVDADTANALSSGRTGAGGSSMRGLKAGALGNTVKQLQQALIDAGIKVRGGADGIFGPATAHALKDFQAAQGIPATGVVDDATVAALANPKQPTAPAAPASGGFAVFGEKGPRVVALQQALVQAGIRPRGGVDGQFGGGTSAAVMEFQRANGLPVTGKVTDETAAELGLDRMEKPKAPDVTTLQLAAFPVEGPCHYADTFGFPRSAGRVHLGVDIIAPAGKRIYAVADGKITKVYVDRPGSLAGHGVRLTMADGTYFFYAHMLAVADGLTVGSEVTAGQVIGTVGSTGNSGTNHLHFEAHPKGGSAVNPYPLVKAVGGC